MRPPIPFLLVLAMGSLAWAQDASEDDAKKKIEEFDKAKSKGKTDEDLRAALAGLATIKHAKILKILEHYLKSGSDLIKRTAADLIGHYKGDKGAAEELLSSLNTEAGKATRNKTGDDVGHENAVAILGGLSQIGWKGCADKLNGYFEHANVEVAASAVRTAASIGSLDSIDHLIKLLLELEAINTKPPPPPPPAPKAAPSGKSSGKTGNAPPPPPAAPAGPDPAAISRKEQEHRKTTLEPAVQDALKRITGENTLRPAAEWSKFWNQNKAKLKAKEAENK